MAKHGGDVVRAERELLSFALGLRLHHHEHPRLHLLGLFTGVIADISSVNGTKCPCSQDAEPHALMGLGQIIIYNFSRV